MNLYLCYGFSDVSLSAYVTPLKKNSLLIRQPTLEAAVSKAWVCGASFAAIAGSNPTGATMCVSCEGWVLLGRDACVGLNPRSEESY